MLVQCTAMQWKTLIVVFGHWITALQLNLTELAMGLSSYLLLQVGKCLFLLLGNCHSATTNANSGTERSNSIDK